MAQDSLHSFYVDSGSNGQRCGGVLKVMGREADQGDLDGLAYEFGVPGGDVRGIRRMTGLPIRDSKPKGRGRRPAAHGLVGQASREPGKGLSAGAE